MTTERARVVVRGAVQGVGFRPCVHRLASDLGLNGWVLNSSQGVRIEIEGERSQLDQFLLRLDWEKPPLAYVQSWETTFLEPKGFTEFTIRPSEEDGPRTALILPDIAPCVDCLREIFDPADRRHLYPFVNCTNCGPRFSIIEALPYDRPNTSMRCFSMCAECEAEYHDPGNRRFHAQPNACPACGPHLQFLDEKGNLLEDRHAALAAAENAIRDGRIVALKSVGGFQLVVDARDDAAVRRLRRRKLRTAKPLAIMVENLESVRALCHLPDSAARLLASSEAPIVLLREDRSNVAPSVAPGNPNLGVMLPSSPLHHILMRNLGFPVVATSGNLSDEPICIDNAEAVERLAGIADFFLVHDRPIVRHVDDSVVRILLGREQMMRRARGYAPLPVHVAETLPPVLGVGAQLKNAVALGVGNDVFVSQHIGDLETPSAYDAFRRVCQDFQTLYDVAPEAVACDAHPGYLSSQFAEGLGSEPVRVQHHFAHVLSCMAENELAPPVLGIAWDGTGLGTDGTIWGGEFLVADGSPFTRVAHFRTFKLPGGEAAIREPRRCALGLHYAISGDELFDHLERAPLLHFHERERSLLRQALDRDTYAPQTSSVGRLFDAVASLLEIRQQAEFEGQAAMDVEFAAEETETRSAYPCELKGENPIVIDWEPMVIEILRDVQRGEFAGFMAAKFHNALVEAAVAVTHRVGIERVVLVGGCFQNRLLTERLVERLREEGFRPFWHQRVPTNDGGIALGQVVAAGWTLGRGRQPEKEKRKELSDVPGHPR